jgi:hypothetical protein
VVVVSSASRRAMRNVGIDLIRGSLGWRRSVRTFNLPREDTRVGSIEQLDQR